MSCFLCSNETINRVVHLLAIEPGSGDLRMMPPGWHDAVGQELQRLNAQAVCDRYGMDSLAFELYRWSPMHSYNHFELLKAAQCWKYQASDADSAKDFLIYQQVEKAIRVIMRLIVESLPEYDQAAWDAPESKACCGEAVEFSPEKSA